MPHEPRPAPHNPLAEDLLAALEQVFGLHPGFRPVHAKGRMYRGTFPPTPAAAALSRALHLNQPSTPVIVRLSDFAGVPSVADPTSNWPAGRPEVQLGTITLTERADEADPETRKIIFDPIRAPPAWMPATIRCGTCAPTCI